jgi:hypothetical protein
MQLKQTGVRHGPHQVIRQTALALDLIPRGSDPRHQCLGCRDYVMRYGFAHHGHCSSPLTIIIFLAVSACSQWH